MASDIRNIEAQLSAVVIANAKENAQLRAELEQVKRDACELANLALMIGDVTDAGDLELVNKYTGRN